MEKTDSNQELIDLLEAYKTVLMAWDSGIGELDDGTPVRTYINRNTRAVHKVVRRAGCSKTITVSPPPAVGGMIMRSVDPFSCVFQGPYGMNMVPIISDMIDEAVGVIMAGELPPERKEPQKGGSKQRPKHSNWKVFVVHGHDNEAKQSIARFLEKLGLEAIILHERTNAGLTIIEKFEKNSDVAYAVVLMTPDDVGALENEKQKLQHRARQNVILELGYFMGRLGREHVCALLKGDIERPSDSDGIIYIALDPNDGWKILLAKELKEAGLNIDLNKAM